MSLSEINSKGVSKSQAIETQNEYLDVYCLIIFTPYLNRRTSSDFLKQDKTEEGASLNNEQNSFFQMGTYNVPNVVYADDLCGVNRGIVAESHQMVVDCSEIVRCDKLDLNIVSEKVLSVELGIKKILEKYWNIKQFVTLHLAIYSFSATKDFANCFLYGYKKLNQFRPIEIDSEEFLNQHFSLLKIYANVGYSIIVDYVCVYETEPFAFTNREVLKNENTIKKKNEQEKNKEQRTNNLPAKPEKNDNETGLLRINTWPTTPDGKLIASVSEDVGFPDDLVFEGDSNRWTWKRASSIVHKFFEGTGIVSGIIGIGAAIVAGIAAAIVLVSGGAIALGGLVAGALVVATYAGLVSLASSVSNGYLYLAEYGVSMRNDNYEEAEKAIELAQNEFFWTCIGEGTGKVIGKYVLQPIVRNIKIKVNKVHAQNQQGYSGLLENERTLTQKMNDNTTKINSNRQTIIEKENLLNKLQKKYDNYSKANNKPEATKSQKNKYQNKMDSLNNKMNDTQKDIDQLTKENVILETENNNLNRQIGTTNTLSREAEWEVQNSKQAIGNIENMEKGKRYVPKWADNPVDLRKVPETVSSKIADDIKENEKQKILKKYENLNDGE